VEEVLPPIPLDPETLETAQYRGVYFWVIHSWAEQIEKHYGKTGVSCRMPKDRWVKIVRSLVKSLSQGWGWEGMTEWEMTQVLAAIHPYRREFREILLRKGSILKKTLEAPSPMEPSGSFKQE
jgi:hypothetical protein